MNRRTGIMLALAAITWLIYAATVPENHTAAEDAYAYATAVEKAPFDSIGKRHHVLYVPLMSGVLHAVRRLGYRGRAFPLLVAVSVLCGGMLVALAYRYTRQGHSATHCYSPTSRRMHARVFLRNLALLRRSRDRSACASCGHLDPLPGVKVLSNLESRTHRGIGRSGRPDSCRYGCGRFRCCTTVLPYPQELARSDCTCCMRRGRDSSRLRPAAPIGTAFFRAGWPPGSRDRSNGSRDRLDPRG